MARSDVVVCEAAKIFYGCFASYTTSVTCGDSFSSRRSLYYVPI